MQKIKDISKKIALFMLFMSMACAVTAQVIPPRKPGTTTSSATSSGGRVSTVGKPKPVEAKKELNPYDQFGQYKAKVDVYGRPIPAGAPKKQSITQRTRPSTTSNSNGKPTNTTGSKGTSAPATGYRYYERNNSYGTGTNSGLSARYRSTSYQSSYSRERAASNSAAPHRYYSGSGSNSRTSSGSSSYYNRGSSSSSGNSDVHVHYHYTKPASVTRPGTTPVKH